MTFNNVDRNFVVIKVFQTKTVTSVRSAHAQILLLNEVVDKNLI